MFNKLIRLGRDSEMRQTQAGKKVLNFAGAYDVGYGQNKHTQWIDCALWGDRGEAVQQHLVKGCQIVIYADDLEVEKFAKNDGSEGAKLKCRIVSFDFAGPKPDSAPPQQQYQQQAPQQAPPQQQAPQAQQPAPQAGSYDDFYDDIPFAPIGLAQDNIFIHCV